MNSNLRLKIGFYILLILTPALMINSHSVVFAEDITIIDVVPGRNELIKVSANAPNMIRAPFDNPKVMDLSEKEAFTCKVQGRNIYFTPFKTVGFYITNQKGDVVFPITVIPQQRGGATTVYLRYNDADKEEALKWEQASDYQKTIIKLTRAMIVDMPPSGYSVRKSDVKYEPIQKVFLELEKEYVGSNLVGQIVKLTNMTPFEIELQSNKFYFNGARAVSFDEKSIRPQETIRAYFTVTRKGRK